MNDDDVLNLSLRRFLKRVGVSSQKEIERVVREKSLRGKGILNVKVVLSSPDVNLNHVVEGQIDLG